MTVPGRIAKNTKAGQTIAQVEQLGRVPPCVRDAFSWLPYPWGKIGHGKNAKKVWFWEYNATMPARSQAAPTLAPPPPIQAPSSERCNLCIFQEPEWSQGYAGCSHSWLWDHDGDCQAFYSRDELLARRPEFADFCKVPALPELEGDPVLDRPYRPGGKPYSVFTASCHWPSAYIANLNMRAFAQYAHSVYSAVMAERWRRFWQWAEEETLKREGRFQYSFLT